jgi:hypothetical protein
MPDFTEVFFDVYDALVAISQPVDDISERPLRLYDDSGALLTTLITGIFTKQVSAEQNGGRSLELRILDRTGLDLGNVKWFGYSGIRYEVNDEPDPPLKNPRQWVYLLRPVGLDLFVAGDFDLIDDVGNLIIDDTGMQIMAT